MYLFMVSSTIETDRGIFSHGERLEQTLRTFESIHRMVPNADIVLYESGATLSEEHKNILSRHCNLICLQNVPDIVELSKRRLNSHAEAIATHIVLSDPIMANNQIKRIFKISGRYKLQDTFDIKAYDDIGDKFVFSRRRKTWLPEERQKELGIDALFNTRLYSFTPNLVEYYKKCLINVYNDLRFGIDLEHSLYKNMNKNLVIEFDKVHCEGRIAPDGSTEID